MQWLAIVALFIVTGKGGSHFPNNNRIVDPSTDINAGSTGASFDTHKINFTTRNKFMRRRRRPRIPSVSDRASLNSDIKQIQVENSEILGTNWFTQTIDHFNADETRTFEQQWFYNYKYGSQNGPNFLMIGGAYPENMGWVMHENVTWMLYAKAVGANVFSLAHRYYGQSKLGTNDLQYLTSAQMLYDAAIFISAQQIIQNLTGPWITFGGSYAGNLAAWSRQWFPDLILGSVASSAPVQAKIGFYESLEVVEDVIKKQSQKCYERVAEAFARFYNLAQNSSGRATIQEKFNLYPAWKDDPIKIVNPFDMNTVFNALYGIFEDVVLNNDVGWMDMKLLCSHFENETIDDPVDRLSALRHTYSSDAIQSSFDAVVQHFIDMKGYIDGYGNKYDDDELSDVLWMWQSCNEFGHYHTTYNVGGIFGTSLPINYFVILCERVFGVGQDHMESGIRATNYAYGGRTRYNATNVVFVNGDADPWHALSILERGNRDESVVPVVIKDTSHCADMYGESRADPLEMVQSRRTILQNIQKWIASVPSTEFESHCVIDNSFSATGWKCNEIWLDAIALIRRFEQLSLTESVLMFIAPWMKVSMYVERNQFSCNTDSLQPNGQKHAESGVKDSAQPMLHQVEYPKKVRPIHALSGDF